jgi:hypothetical protein
MSLKPGMRLKSVTDTTEVVVVRGSDDPVEVCCGGVAMVAHGDEVAAGSPPAAGFDDGTELGKRYEDPESGLELLCTKGGPASLSIGTVLLTRREAKPLPSSD